MESIAADGGLDMDVAITGTETPTAILTTSNKNNNNDNSRSAVRFDVESMHKPRLLTCQMPEQQQLQPEGMRMRSVSWVSERHLLLRLRRRRCRDVFITFRQPNVIDKTQGQKVIVRNPGACENAEAPHNRRLTSSSRSLSLYTSSISPPRIKNEVSCSWKTNDSLRRTQMSVGRGVIKGGGSEPHTPQLTRGKTSAGECPRIVGLPGKEWVRLVRANPEDPVLRRLDACASSSGRGVEHRSIGSRQESTSGCGSLTGKKFPTLNPLPSQAIRTKPFNAAIGVRNQSSVSSLFQQSCEQIFTSNRCRYQWITTGNEPPFQERFQQRKEEEEEEEELTRLAVNRFVPEEYEYFTAKTPNNSPAPDNVIDEVRQNDIGHENQQKEKDSDDILRTSMMTMRKLIEANRSSNTPVTAFKL